MTQHDDDTDGLPDLSNRELLRLVMQEIVDTRVELKEDIMTEVRKELADIKTDLTEVKKDVKDLQADVHTLRVEVHQNQSAFISNHDALEKRVKILEMAA